MSAKRIQRKRTKGWRMPEGAVYVGRPSRWGNPFSIKTFGRQRSITLFRNAIVGFWTPSLFGKDEPDALVGEAYRLHDWMARSRRSADQVRADLRGNDLACWCPLEDADGNPVPCHADVLLELANQGESR